MQTSPTNQLERHLVGMNEKTAKFIKGSYLTTQKRPTTKPVRNSIPTQIQKRLSYDASLKKSLVERKSTKSISKSPSKPATKPNQRQSSDRPLNISFSASRILNKEEEFSFEGLDEIVQQTDHKVL